MPIKYVCHSCGRLIAEVMVTKRGVLIRTYKAVDRRRYLYRSFDEVPQFVNSLRSCPHCGSALSDKPLEVRVDWARGRRSKS